MDNNSTPKNIGEPIEGMLSGGQHSGAFSKHFPCLVRGSYNPGGRRVEDTHSSSTPVSNAGHLSANHQSPAEW